MQCAKSTDAGVHDSAISVQPTSSDITSSPIIDSFYKSYYELEELCLQNSEFFKNDQSDRGQRIHGALVAWVDWIKLAKELVGKIHEFAHEYDFDEHTPGNGFRSFVTVTNSCVEYGLKIVQNLTATRTTMFFRKKFYMKEVESCSQLLLSLCTCLRYLLILREWATDGDLFGKGKHSAEELFEKGDTINQYCFYGRCLGFQYTDSIRGVLRFISISMAGFSESFYSEDSDGPIAKTTRSVWTGGKYFLNPELRARRIVNISQNANIHFCKSFWFLAESELMQRIPGIVGSSIKVNKIIEIPSEPLRLELLDNSKKTKHTDDVEYIDIPVPRSHVGPGTVSVRLLSYNRYEGMIGEGTRWRKLLPPSKSILFHCHGGGFVAQSSKSHELYLRDWAVNLNTPILSVDYSLAPAAPFPRALEEVFYAFCWMVKNASLLGTTAERIVCAGDSAGANLCIGLTLKCIEYGIRAPDGVFLAYCPTLVSFVPSPARLLCLMDPLLPFGFMMRCLRAYAAPSDQQLEETHKKQEQFSNITHASHENITHYLDASINAYDSTQSSRRTSMTRSPISSVAENSNWEALKAAEIREGMPLNGSTSAVDCESSDTFASASYHSQTVERTELLSAEDNSSCVSFESDSQPIIHMPIENGKAIINTVNHEKSDSENYIDRFMEKYVVDTTTIEAKENGFIVLKGGLAKTYSEENILIETGKEVIAGDSIHDRLNNAVNSISSTINKYISSSEIKKGQDKHHIQDLRNMDALIARSPSLEFQFEVPKDPFLSPYWANDEWLAHFPKTSILSVDMDPCLDDCVSFAKKLKSLGRPVSLDILKGLPHGFLNFTMLSSEAMDGSKHCIKCLKDLLNPT